MFYLLYKYLLINDNFPNISSWLFSTCFFINPLKNLTENVAATKKSVKGCLTNNCGAKQMSLIIFIITTVHRENYLGKQNLGLHFFTWKYISLTFALLVVSTIDDNFIACFKSCIFSKFTVITVLDVHRL